MRNHSNLLITTATSLWATLLLVGFVSLTVYANTAGPQGNVPTEHPELGLGADKKRFRLEMFAHPRCPCTRASIRQLAQVMSRTQSDVKATVWMFSPAQESPGWAYTDVWRAAEILPDVNVKLDHDGKQSRAFGSKTSGHVLVYDRAGQLAFSGGITSGRSHEGDNLGFNSVLNILNGRQNAVRETPVFGCPILDEGS